LVNETKLAFAISTSFTLLSSFFFTFIVPIAQASDEPSDAAYQMPKLPKIYDIDLKVEVFSRGLDFPSNFAFLGPNDILVLEKNTGQVRRITNGSLLPDPLLDLNVSNRSERGMLGIAVQNNENNKGRLTATDVFLYFTESIAKDIDNQAVRNSLYKYQLADNRLINPKKLLDLPTTSGPGHNGGSITIGPDKNVYFIVGDLNVLEHERSLTRVENSEQGRDPDGRAGILRVTQDGQPVPNVSLIGDQHPLNLYYAYGIRNGFGLDFDPGTGKLWDTENGPDYGDEINLVEPGFNSGWNKVQGIWKDDGSPVAPIMSNRDQRDMLVTFDGQGKYSNPEFTWEYIVGPTALKFLNSDKLGKHYENDMFVGDFHGGNVYQFDLTENRTALELGGFLKDKVANNREEVKATMFGQGFGGITDIEVGPDGYLYILSVHQGGIDCVHNIPDKPCVPFSSTVGGTIFRIVPQNFMSTQNARN
jgi:aldose sugar dehydrogenase